MNKVYYQNNNSGISQGLQVSRDRPNFKDSKKSLNRTKLGFPKQLTKLPMQGARFLPIVIQNIPAYVYTLTRKVMRLCPFGRVI